MRVLLTNDDGIFAPGLQALLKAYRADHQVTVVAPDRERSAIGHAITLHQPLRYEKTRMAPDLTAYAVNGTPADCVKLALAEILVDPPDLVVSGVNPGANVGININYSGTVAAAKEATLAGVPALAVSVTAPGGQNMDGAARFAESFSRQMMEKPFPKGTFLNINLPDLPAEEIRGIRWCRQGNGMIAQQFEKRWDPRNRIYYWQGVDGQCAYDQPDVDCAALGDQYVTITPIKCDMTDYDTLQELARWDISFSTS